ncbi:MAG: hypothetical protein J3R72DRAFT_445511 [Linnemannia gamsii]|nr:MAG: hypothetical protein J3R72DRAFT_445511 [Linnemannia gamsii]
MIRPQLFSFSFYSFGCLFSCLRDGITTREYCSFNSFLFILSFFLSQQEVVLFCFGCRDALHFWLQQDTHRCKDARSIFLLHHLFFFLFPFFFSFLW